MFSEYTLFSDQSTSTGINELSPSSDAIVTNHWNTSHSAPIGKSPIQENSSPPPHILGMFSPSSKTESLLSSLVLSPQDIAYSSPRSEFSDDEDFSFSPQLAEHDEFLQSMGGMEDVEIPYYGERAAQRVSRQPISSPSWQNTNVPYTSPVGSPQYGSPPFTKLAKSPATPIPPAGQSMEHPHGEHPSRTLFVRNINSNVEEQEIRDLFEAYGPTRSIYSQCKHRGFVMVSFYDIRHAKNAIRHLQGRLLRRRKLDIHYSIPRNNPSEKDQNQGTLVVFNLDPSTTHNELLEIFGAFGEIKEIRETPNKKHHKFIEFYDVRDAEQAMKFLNRTEIKGKRIKIEPSRPGGRKANNSQGSPVNSVQRDSAFQNPSNYLYSSSYDGSGFQDFAGYDTISTSYSPPSSFNSSMFIPPPTNSSPVSQVGSSGQFLRPPRSISLPASHQDAKRNRSRSAISQSSWEQNINARGAPHSATSSPKEEENSQFVLDVNEILSGLETRTTLMIRNIPNKYTQKMLLSAIDEVSRGLYDFFYLPIDFKNKCNVGYAFINFIHPLSIVEFYNSFHQQKWERFNSEKVCKISFARIQGKESLVLRFQNSSLMSEDKKCRPIIFYSNGPRVGQQEPFPVGSNVSVRQEDNFASSYTPPMQIPFQRLSSDDPAKPSRLRSLSFNPIS